MREIRFGMSPACSVSRIIRSLCVPSWRGIGLRYLDWYVPQPASRRMRLVIGDDHFACWMCEGWKSVRPLDSGVEVALPPPMLFEAVYCSDQWTLTLLRG